MALLARTKADTAKAVRTPSRLFARFVELLEAIQDSLESVRDLFRTASVFEGMAEATHQFAGLVQSLS